MAAETPNPPQPAPQPGTATPTWELVHRDFLERDATGARKYGVRHQHDNGRLHLVDLYQELLDAVVYARAEIERRKLPTEYRLTAIERCEDALWRARCEWLREHPNGVGAADPKLLRVFVEIEILHAEVTTPAEPESGTATATTTTLESRLAASEAERERLRGALEKARDRIRHYAHVCSVNDDAVLDIIDAALTPDPEPAAQPIHFLERSRDGARLLCGEAMGRVGVRHAYATGEVTCSLCRNLLGLSPSTPPAASEPAGALGELLKLAEGFHSDDCYGPGCHCANEKLMALLKQHAAEHAEVWANHEALREALATAHRRAGEMEQERDALRSEIEKVRAREAEGVRVFDGIVADLRAEVERLKQEIGAPRPGSHPDEAKPRDVSWHAERANWTAEVEQLRKSLSAALSRAEQAEKERDEACGALAIQQGHNTDLRFQRKSLEARVRELESERGNVCGSAWRDQPCVLEPKHKGRCCTRTGYRYSESDLIREEPPKQEADLFARVRELEAQLAAKKVKQAPGDVGVDAHDCAAMEEEAASLRAQLAARTEPSACCDQCERESGTKDVPWFCADCWGAPWQLLGKLMAAIDPALAKEMDEGDTAESALVDRALATLAARPVAPDTLARLEAVTERLEQVARVKGGEVDRG